MAEEQEIAEPFLGHLATVQSIRERRAGPQQSLSQVFQGQSLRGARAVVLSPELVEIEDLATFFDFSEVLVGSSGRTKFAADVVLSWGASDLARAKKFAQQINKPLLRVAAGFFQGPAVTGKPLPLSLIADARGIYFDARHSSQFEEQILGDGRLNDAAACARARQAIEFIRRERISGGARVRPAWADSDRPKVLLVDQARDPALLQAGLVPPDAPRRMVEWARSRHADAQLVIVTAAEARKSPERSFLLSGLQPHDRAGIIIHDQPTNWHLLMEAAEEVLVGTSAHGFTALLHEKPVTCFGVPFYAGWGLTRDQVPAPRRGSPRSVEQLALAAWLLSTRYVHPTYRQRCELEDILRLLSVQERRWAELPGRTVAVGFSGWKQQSARAYFQAPGAELEFVGPSRLEKALGATAVDRVLIWGQRLPEPMERQLYDRNVRLERVEDGFLRSVQLGSDLTAPSSLVRDSRGIYYDPTRPSDLEVLLQDGAASAGDLARAARLREQLVRLGLTKYNVQRAQPPRIQPQERPILLVVGQVDGDASVRLGGGEIDTSGKLVRAVRAARPEAFLLFKPHPDVVSGNRPGRLSAEEERLVDAVEEQASSIACLSVAQEVHTLTSLLGFEALLREVPVYTYGLPFYAGWGLTQDRMTSSRRTRRLSLDELTFQTLIAYPLYMSQRTGYHAEVEEVVFELEQTRQQTGDPDVRASWRRQLGRAVRYLRGAWHAR